LKFATFLSVIVILSARGQVPSSVTEFEVASVKRAEGGPPPRLPPGVADRIFFGGGTDRIDYARLTLKNLLARAYNLNSHLISGPSWLDEDRYTISAKLPPGTNRERLQLMLQRLLAERFDIKTHRSVKVTTVYRLKVAEKGPKLLPAEVVDSTADHRAVLAADVAKMVANDKPGARLPPGKPKSPYSNWFHLPNATVGALAEQLSFHLDHAVKDMTDLKGNYAFYLHWTKNRPLSTEVDLGTDSSEPSLFNALKAQLGLKLELGKEPVELLIVDRASRNPKEN
jgi:uncharacterized protein (TIGR03435 family)